jgi:predicted acyltransferase
MLGVARADAFALVVTRPAERIAPAQRLACLDACRGIAVIGMLVANLVNVCLHDVPRVLTHNYGDTLHLFDLPAPLFQFLVGVSLPLFLAHRRRAGRGEREAGLDAVRRFTLLIALGVLLDGAGALSLVPRWGVLQTLGLGGIIATAFVGLPRSVSVAVALALLALFSGLANGVVHASPEAALAFVPLTLAGLFVGEALAREGGVRVAARRAASVAAVTLPLAAGLWAGGVPFNKLIGTSSFVALSTATSAAVFALAARVEAEGGRFPAWLLATGRSALTAWVLLYVLVYYPAWLVFPGWERLALSPGLAAVTAVTAVLCATTVSLERRSIRVPL